MANWPYRPEIKRAADPNSSRLAAQTARRGSKAGNSAICFLAEVHCRHHRSSGIEGTFLGKHLREVDRFFRFLKRSRFQSEAANKLKQRFERNQERLFTFLQYDGVPWNNNNAEHAIKSFARLRDIIAGSSTKKGIEEYLTLLSVAESCKYRGVDFLDFLRSGETDIATFARPLRPSRGASAV